MKKIIFTAALVAFAMASQAQIFVGGNLGFSSNTSKNDGNKTNKITGLTIAPYVGYQINEKLAAGVRVNFNSEKVTDFKFLGDNDQITTTSGFSAGVFAQYTFLNFGKFSVYADGEIAFGSNKEKVKLGTTITETKSSVFGINIVPCLAYNLSDNISLIANLNFMSLGFTSTKDKDAKTANTDFGIDVNANNVAEVGALTIGFIYKF